jgi:hypothetical protein
VSRATCQLRSDVVTASLQRVDKSNDIFWVSRRLVVVSNTQYCWNKIISKGIGTQPKNCPSAVVSDTNSPETTLASTEEDVQRHWQGVVKRRSFLKGLGIAGAALSAGTLLATEGTAQTSSSTVKLSKGDIALLQFAAWAEIVESDLWTQYAELGGVGPSGGGTAQSSEEFQKFIGGNPAYNLALQNLDGDMPQYITDNTDDELSHAAFLKAFLKSRGAAPVDLEPFRKLPSSKRLGQGKSNGLPTS